LIKIQKMSPRPKRFRRMGAPPVLQGFLPVGVCSGDADSISIQYEEFEALKLADYENLSQEVAARKMGVSRPTFTRIYNLVRKKIARAFVEGKSICFEGGMVSFNKEWYRCKECHHVFFLIKNEKKFCPHCNSDNLESINYMIRKGVYGKPGGHFGRSVRDQKYCTCPNCGTEVVHVPGNPCNQTFCPSCNHRMQRLF